MGLLDRAPHAYRVGYWDATAQRPRRTDKQDGIETPFAGHDYNEGYDAGFNDVYWHAHNAMRRELAERAKS